MTDTVEPPIACSLDAGNLKERLDRIGKLNARALLGSIRDDLILTLDYAPNAIDDVRQMIAGEQSCCAFLMFAVFEQAKMVRVTITAPETAREAAEALFEPFAAQVGGTNAQAVCGCKNGCGA